MPAFLDGVLARLCPRSYDAENLAHAEVSDLLRSEAGAVSAVRPSAKSTAGAKDPRDGGTKSSALGGLFVGLVGALVSACSTSGASPPASERVHVPSSDAITTTSSREQSSARCEKARAESRSEEILLAFAGDVIAHEALRHAAALLDRRDEAGRSSNQSGYGAILDVVREAIVDADLAFANLESPVTEIHRRRGSMMFRADEPLLAALAATGFGVVSVANNHAYDQGARGLSDTLAAAAKHGLIAVGAGATSRDACAPRMFDVRGMKIALLAQTLYMNFREDEGPPRVCMLALGPLTRTVRAARAAGAALVVAYLHWGNEYETSVRRDQIDYARMLVERGVDLVVGHHPHVLQRVERIKTSTREGVVAYSLGNLLSNQGYDFDAREGPDEAGDTRDAAVLRVRVGRDDAGRARIGEVTAVPFWTKHEGTSIVLTSARERRGRIADRLGVRLTAVSASEERCVTGQGAASSAARSPR